jgi:anaerobic dimethyl sulfoxide reductase subunit B (iron-sulfur subunit)
VPEQLGFHADASACINCKACQIACQDKHDLPAGVKPRRVLQYGGGEWSVADGVPIPGNVFTYSVSISCMHCSSPACVPACEAGAITKRADGVVVIDPEKCTGCRSCEGACPYGALQVHPETGVMTKCDLCQDLLAQGLNPACVDACQMRALHVGPLEKLRCQYGHISAVAPLPVSGTEPSLVVTPHRHSQPSGEGTGKLLSLPVRA